MQDQVHVFIGDSRSDAHVSHNRGHHPRRKFMWSGVASAAVGSEPLLARGSHCIAIFTAVDGWSCRSSFRPRLRRCMHNPKQPENSGQEDGFDFHLVPIRAKGKMKR
jgi:hypothetical protein